MWPGARCRRFVCTGDVADVRCAEGAELRVCWRRDSGCRPEESEQVGSCAKGDEGRLSERFHGEGVKIVETGAPRGVDFDRRGCEIGQAARVSCTEPAAGWMWMSSRLKKGGRERGRRAEAQKFVFCQQVERAKRAD